MPMTPDQARWFSDTFASVVRNVERAILGKTEAIRLAVTCMLAEGHLLLEDYPGTGKTTLARVDGPDRPGHPQPDPVHPRLAA